MGDAVFPNHIREQGKFADEAELVIREIPVTPAPAELAAAAKANFAPTKRKRTRRRKKSASDNDFATISRNAPDASAPDLPPPPILIN